MKDLYKSKKLLMAQLEESVRNYDSLLVKYDDDLIMLKQIESKLTILNSEFTFQLAEKAKRSEELVTANVELVYQVKEKAKRAEELVTANIELAFQVKEKAKRAEELVTANIELAYQVKEKAKRADELVTANIELAYQVKEKAKRADELVIAKEIAEEFEKKFKQIAENVDEVFWLRTESEMIYVSPSFEKIWGIPCQSIYENQERLIDPIHPKDKTVVQEILQSREFADKVMFEYEFRILCPDNKIHWISSKTFPILDDKGKIIKRAGIARDITDKYQNIDELVKAMEKAENSDRLKSAFLANMSHEIRTPMNGILGFAELLKEPNLSGEEQQEFIGIIEKSGLRMLNIINNIIDISKIESGLMGVNKVEFNINEQIEYLLTFFKPELESKNLNIQFSKPFQLEELPINSDKEKFLAILMNLLKNAIKYTDNGTIEVGYQFRHKYIEFFVKDTGIGIFENRQQAIFDRFIQADIEDQHAFQGAGLGLAISKSYVELMNGTIWVESEFGKGSAFYFTIPYSAKPGQDTESEIPTIAKEGKVQSGYLKILVVEDDKTSERFIVKTVGKISSQILLASCGIDAVALCRENPDIDLILIDIGLPDLNGYEATKQIRQFNTEVVIIAQTGFAFETDRESAISAGCNAYISKPYNQNELLSIIHKHCTSPLKT